MPRHPVSGSRLAAAKVSKRENGWSVLALFVLALVLATPWSSAYAACPDRPPCHGCGCKGGPGYRGPDGKCVGFKTLDRVCGKPPETRCVFENAPGTGANRECALEPRERKRAEAAEPEVADPAEAPPAPSGAP